MLRRSFYLIALLSVLAVALLTPPAGAQVAARTASARIVICEPQDLETTVLFSESNDVRLATTTPVVVQTGNLPLSGPGLPVSQLTGVTGNVGPEGQQGYRFRAFDQEGVTVAGRPSENNCYYFSYHASVPFVDAVHAAGIATVNTDARGIAPVGFSRALSATPVSVIVTGSSPYVGPGLPLNLISSSYSRTGFAVRALDQAGNPIASRSIRLHYWATTQAATPNTRAGTATITPDSRGIGFIPWPIFARGLGPVSVVLTGVSPGSGPDMPVNLLAYVFRGDGVAIRVLNQLGRPITSSVRIAFYAIKAPVSPL
jgi:hypothetical protein